MSLAVNLVDRGFAVHVLEKKSNLGGRASSTTDHKTHDPVPIGPHIFVKGYKFFHNFLHKIGAREAIVWERNLFLELINDEHHFQFKMSDLPTSILRLPKLFKYPFISFRDKISNIKFIVQVIFSTRAKIDKLDEISADQYLISRGVSNNSINFMWRFFVLSMLNVPIEQCSASELCHLVKSWIEMEKRQIGFAKVGLGDVYTQKATEYITSRGGIISRNTEIKEIVFNNDEVDHLVIESGGSKTELISDIYVSALNPIQLRELLSEDILKKYFFNHLEAFAGVPYFSVNLWFDGKITHKKFWALLDDSKQAKYFNTDFYDLSNIYETRRGNSYIASNVIYSKAYDNFSDHDIVEKTLQELRIVFPHMKANLLHSHIHRIPYVIYAPYPGMRKHRLSHKTPVKNLYLCGDWINRYTPQSMEAAVQSGYECASIICSL